MNTFIFIGKSGCGKGTQAKLLEAYLRKTDPSKEVLYIQTGWEIREFIKGNSFTQKTAKVLYDTGALQPEFLSIYIWTNVLVNKFNGHEHLIFDGFLAKILKFELIDVLRGVEEEVDRSGVLTDRKRSSFGETDILRHELKGEVGLRAGRFEFALYLNDVFDVGRQKRRGAAD